MPLIGIVARKKDIKDIKRKLGENYELIKLNSESIKNLKNIKFAKHHHSRHIKVCYSGSVQKLKRTYSP